MNDRKSQIRQIKLSELDNVIARHLLGCRPVMFWGDPGIGKTQRVRYSVDRIARVYNHLDIGYLEFSPNALTAQDIGGYPKPPMRPEEKTFSLVPIDMFERLTGHQVAIVYIDEINTAEPMTLAALLRLVQERRAGQFELPLRTLFIATANPAEMTIAGQDIGHALSSRFTHLHVTVDPSDFVKNFPSYWGASREELAQRIVSLTGNIEKELDIWAEKRALVAAYIHHNPQALLQPPPEVGIDRSTGYPNPRNWEAVSTILAGHEILQSGDLEADLAGTIGSDFAFSFAHWYYQRDLPDPARILEDPSRAPIPRRPDMAFATLSALTSHIISRFEENDPDIENWIENAILYIERYILETQALDIVQVTVGPFVKEMWRRNLMARYIAKAGLNSKIIDIFEKEFEQAQRIRRELESLKGEKKS